MRYCALLTIFLAMPISISLIVAGDTPDRPAIDAWLQEGDRQVFDKLVGEYRNRGQDGLDTLLAMRSRESLVRLIGSAAVEHDAVSQRLDTLIDAVGGQKYCSVSGLYWYTDFAKAQRRAHETNKPILSLRMLGQLTEDLSCANSRFFRTTLYANEEVAKTLRDHFVLHWKSVRPVPVVTIDFGDGRVLRRTLTGNSAHYILSENGDVIDALPGLYGPTEFLDGLKRARQAAVDYREMGFTKNSASRIASLRREVLRRYHAERIDAIATAWDKDFATASKKLGREPVTTILPVNAVLTVPSRNPPQTPPNAVEAGSITVAKIVLEFPLLRPVMRARLSALDAATDGPIWKAIADLHRDRVKLDGRSRQLIARHHPPATTAVRVAVTKADVETPLVRMMRSLQENIALDTVRNEYLLHRQIHEWLMNSGEEKLAVDRLNERVYDELFLTPSSDPWLGLMQPDVYSGLPNGGIVPAPRGEGVSQSRAK